MANTIHAAVKPIPERMPKQLIRRDIIQHTGRMVREQRYIIPGNVIRCQNRPPCKWHMLNPANRSPAGCNKSYRCTRGYCLVKKIAHGETGSLRIAWLKDRIAPIDSNRRIGTE